TRVGELLISEQACEVLENLWRAVKSGEWEPENARRCELRALVVRDNLEKLSGIHLGLLMKLHVYRTRPAVDSLHSSVLDHALQHRELQEIDDGVRRWTIPVRQFLPDALRLLVVACLRDTLVGAKPLVFVRD